MVGDFMDGFILAILLVLAVVTAYYMCKYQYSQKRLFNTNIDDACVLETKFVVKSVTYEIAASGSPCARYVVHCSLNLPSGTTTNEFYFYDLIDKYRVGDVLRLNVKETLKD